MSLTTLRTILGLVFLVHGIGHSMALLLPCVLCGSKKGLTTQHTQNTMV